MSPKPALAPRIAPDRDLHGERLGNTYVRTAALAGIDPQGMNLCVDLTSIVDTPGRELSFSAVGCHGTLTAAFTRMEGASQLGSILARKVVGQQRRVGSALKRWHLTQRQARTQSFGFLLGDNFYESGLPKTDSAVVDAMFEQGYRHVYNELDGKPLGIPYFGLLGNHDYNIHDRALVPPRGSAFAESMSRALAEVDYGYRVGNGWHMPYRYYLVISPVADFFVIDTSTLLFDPQQQAWLRAMHAQLAANGKWKLLMAHHGCVSFRRRSAAAHTGLNRRIFEWLVAEDLHFHLNVAAHDHCSAAALLEYRSPAGVQRHTYYVLAGGGGAALGCGEADTLRRWYPEIGRIDLLARKHGFATFELTGSRVTINFELYQRAGWRGAWDAPVTLDLQRADAWSSA